MDVINFIRILLRRARLLLLVPLVAMAVAFLLTRGLEDTYKSKAVLAAGILDDTRISISENENLTSSFLIQTKFSNLIELITSKASVQLTSYKLLIHDLEEPVPFRSSTLYGTLNAASKQHAAGVVKNLLANHAYLNSGNPDELGIKRLTEAQRYNTEALLKKLKVERAGNSDFIEIEFESENPQLSAFVVNTLCEEFIQYYRGVVSIKTDASTDFFRRLAEEKRKELSTLVDNLKVYKMDKNIINLYEQTKSLVNQLSAVEILRENTQKEIPSLTEAIRKIDEKFESKDKQYVEAQLLKYNTKIAALKDRVNELNERYIQSGLTQTALLDSVNALKRAIDAEIKLTTDNLLVDPNITRQELLTKRITFEIELEVAKQSVKSIDKELKRLQNIINGFTPAEATISSMEREIGVAAETYLLILNKWNLARFASEEAGTNLALTERGYPADKPEPNKRNLLTILAGVLALLLTVIGIFIFEYLDLTIKTPKQFTRITGLPLLGVVNSVAQPSLDLKNLFQTETGVQEIEFFKNTLRRLRSAFIASMGSGKVALFTGTASKEGKSFILISLAYALHFIGKRVLIIDTNLKNPSLTRNFQAAPLLEECLAGERSAADSISNTTVAEIKILGAKGLTLSPSEVNGERALIDLVNSLRDDYDYIFLEGPGVNANPDSRELLACADKIVPVFMANIILQEADKYSIAWFKSLGSQCTEAVLNKVFMENLEQLYGETEKPRSRARQLIKQLVQRNLSRPRIGGGA